MRTACEDDPLDVGFVGEFVAIDHEVSAEHGFGFGIQVQV